MEHFLRTTATELSEGEKKRVAFARALYKNLPILVLDEFTSSVSKDMALEMENAILSLEKTMVIHVTHDLASDQREKYDEVLVF